MCLLFAELAQQGRLRAANADVAAQQFAWLVLGSHLDRGMLLGTAVDSTRRANAAADDAVRVFLAAMRRLEAG